MLIQTMIVAHRVPYKFWFHAAQAYFENELAQRYNELVAAALTSVVLAVIKYIE